jgi:hypothetical protein
MQSCCQASNDNELALSAPEPDRDPARHFELPGMREIGMPYLASVLALVVPNTMGARVAGPAHLRPIGHRTKG